MTQAGPGESASELAASLRLARRELKFVRRQQEEDREALQDLRRQVHLFSHALAELLGARYRKSAQQAPDGEGPDASEAALREERAELVALVLDRGIEALPDDTAPEDPTSAERLACERDLVAASGLFDPLDYFLRNPDLAWCLQGHDEELHHFVHTGWRQLRSPYAGFDLWWYWCTYLDPTHEDVNPLVHWLAVGRHLGLSPLPDVQPLRALQHPPTPLRRVCAHELMRCPLT